MQILNREIGAAPAEKIVLELTGPEYDTVLRSLRRMQLAGRGGQFLAHKAHMTYGDMRRAEHLHRELTGVAR